ncbi:MAG: hypothetical protein ACM31E_04230 [Fibrobacterota bacterium]|nr:hypothetical protein [Chitinispirillaceae bacterium]
MSIGHMVLYGLFLFVVSAVNSRTDDGFCFAKENITAVIVASDTIEIRGMYWFGNNSAQSVSTMIYYPFPIDSNASYPCRVNVYKGDMSAIIPHKKGHSGIDWPMTIKPQSTDSIYVKYVQKVKPGYGCYIVSTTKQWTKPLQVADFRVLVPSDWTLSYWSFAADSIRPKGDTLTYFARYYNFFPDSEMFFRWK